MLLTQEPVFEKSSDGWNLERHGRRTLAAHQGMAGAPTGGAGGGGTRAEGLERGRLGHRGTLKIFLQRAGYSVLFISSIFF